MLKSWRQQDIHTPVLIVTARDAVRDKVTGLNLGSDDYLPKPADFEAMKGSILRHLKDLQRM